MAAETTTEVKTEETSPLEKKIIRQIEFYFGDVNLPKDKFLKEKQTEEDGWVTIECLTTFNRLKELSTDLAEICTALKKSDNDLLEINEADLKVRRSKDKPLPDLEDPLVLKAKRMKTLYMKGFPITYTMDQVTDFLQEKGAEPIFVKLRKTDDFKFKGSIFTELKTQEQADKLLEDKEIKIDEEEVMIVMKREEYFTKKNEERRGQGGDGGEKESTFHLDRKTGAIMHFQNVPEGSFREDVKGVFQPHENVAWIDFNKGDTQGYIRFEDDNAAQKAIDAVKSANDGKIIVKETEIEVKVLEGEEDENYWKMAEEEIKKRKAMPKAPRGNRGGRGGRGGRRGGRGGGKRQFNDNKRYGGKRKREWDNGNDNTAEGNDKQGDHVRFDSAPNADKTVSPPKKVKSEE